MKSIVFAFTLAFLFSTVCWAESFAFGNIPFGLSSTFVFNALGEDGYVHGLLDPFAKDGTPLIVDGIEDLADYLDKPHWIDDKKRFVWHPDTAKKVYLHNNRWNICVVLYWDGVSSWRLVSVTKSPSIRAPLPGTVNEVFDHLAESITSVTKVAPKKFISKAHEFGFVDNGASGNPVTVGCWTTAKEKIFLIVRDSFQGSAHYSYHYISMEDWEKYLSISKSIDNDTKNRSVKDAANGF